MGETFLGYPRGDGRAGTRNHLLVLSVTGLTGPAVARIARSLPAAVSIGTGYGASLLGEDRAAHRRSLAGLATHPNAGAVLVVGADGPLVEEIAEAAHDAGKPVEALTLDDCGHDALTLADRGVRAGAALLHRASRQRREPVPLTHLALGLECGRSDPSSGLVANPLVGRAADRIVAAGGTAMIGETTEWLGAEHLLARRAESREVAEAILAAATGREALAVAAGVDLTGNNPSETNIRAGLSSIEEKSLGAIAKSGTGPIAGLLGYGEPPSRPGLWVMDAPAYATESVTGFVAAGCNMVLFTTGVGNSWGSALAPTLKLSGNPETCARLATQIDLDAGAAFTGGESLAAAAERLHALLLDVASGSLTWAEILGETGEAIARFGPSL